ncbi:MAG: NAD-dependent deacylase [Bacteroidales bacterium]|nr:NAD-dependent deacylase [Bacteroidales bacterium]
MDTIDYTHIAELLSKAKFPIAFTGAGISVESGIPPFRGKGGLWNKYDPGFLTLSSFHHMPEKSWSIIKEIFYDHWGEASPNAAHYALAQLEKMGMMKAIITMNIDNLHQKAGSSKVIEYHGTIDRMICEKCGKTYATEKVDLHQVPPRCTCGAVLKPDFIFFEEGIPTQAFNESVDLARKTDLVLVIGTTGEVMPASHIPIIAKQNGATIIEINPSESTYTHNITDIYVPQKAGIAMVEIQKEAQKFNK